MSHGVAETSDRFTPDSHEGPVDVIRQRSDAAHSSSGDDASGVQAPVAREDALSPESARYQRLNIVDRHSAEALNQYCKVNTVVGNVPTRLANLAALQSVLTSLPLALADFAALFSSLFLATGIAERLFGISTQQAEMQAVFFVSLVILPIAQLAGLYPGLGISPVVEFRQLSRSLFASLLVFCGIGWFAHPQMWLFYVASGLLAFCLGTPASIAARYVARHLAKRFRFWGVPVLVLADPERGEELYRRLAKSSEQGFRPVGVLLDADNYWRAGKRLEEQGVPVFDIRRTHESALEHSVTWVIVSNCANRENAPSLDPPLAVIPNRILLSSNQLDMGLWDRLYCVGSTSGLRLGGGRPSSYKLAMKRVMDLTFTLAACLVGLPALLAMYLMVKLSSRGPVFYGQKRIGLGGREFTAWKFRTMQQDADRVLDAYLAKNPAARKEWDEKHKLSSDPRVTRIGQLLRATSFDELPQLWNVLTGEMSLVGPRPIINSPTYDACYVEHYPDEFEAYKSVRPGLTGLWQVACRNRGVYDLRIYWDMYYIRNWCVWLDMYLILRTVKTVLFREGS
ncbi:exopolysaccharide biosynthesis polyprenyl glycosylphosphotransferase [Aureliella helgolandensis]|uniref:UDP-glucose:undecaprenyl-phosphate glucose-1-phosphate transferase n=1 Tax=Aureliella helgolandensis TaxID=2527968 RepID=A0A518GFI3_9BACT|nr:exopolysaccharide biosynthesis polyprenyl glycosylphosphotransferase [Aureliella helgolandensis]QDV27330.1 UDP-glucose:undecaprenyl-phosphate glucose-1-phosphate transferase [Aureliella helgolandensis]